MGNVHHFCSIEFWLAVEKISANLVGIVVTVSCSSFSIINKGTEASSGDPSKVPYFSQYKYTKASVTGF